MQLQRAGGILLHPTSFPSQYGIGDLGKAAYEFIDFLAESGQSLWQVLPLHPVGYGESPYSAYSAFAGNPLLISIDLLRQENLLPQNDLMELPFFPSDRVDFDLVRKVKEHLLRQAFKRFKEIPPQQDYTLFVEQNRAWLGDYALFIALKDYFGGLSWHLWDRNLAQRDEAALMYYRRVLEDDLNYHIFLQYKFDQQWKALRRCALTKGITIIGDLPIFVSHDSSDTWVNPQLFELEEDGSPALVAGVPPDYFSATGQRWGNPHYKWDVMRADDYCWWRARVAKLLEWVDVIRIDHFRGFEAYWEIPSKEETAVKGRWVKGPGEEFFMVMQKYLGKLPFIAEDLGYITPEVHKLKNSLGFPGMKVLQFTYEESLNARCGEENLVYYSGTHDNDTLLGWYRDTLLAGLDRPVNDKDGQDICLELIETVIRSTARWVIIPLQDILGLDSDSRMNLPGTVGGNWRWRYCPESLDRGIAMKIRKLAGCYGRYRNKPFYL